MSGALHLLLFLFIYLFILTANGFLHSGSGTTIRYNTQITLITQNITHHAQTKHSTQNYTHNRGHTTHNEHNVNTITTTTNTITTTTILINKNKHTTH
jgi:hypothetical protein